MKYNTNNVVNTVKVLASDDFDAIPVSLSQQNAEYKAGSPITADGYVALDGESAIGILLYDVDTTKNKAASVVIRGIVDYLKIVSHASVTASASNLHRKIPAIIFRENIKTTPTGDATSNVVGVGQVDYMKI